jgi:ribosomal protein S8
MQRQLYLALNSLNQAARSNKFLIDLQASGFLGQILEWLTYQGYIHSFETFVEFRNGIASGRKFRVFLKYINQSRCLLGTMIILGCPTRLRLVSVLDLRKFQNQTVLLSTTRGLMSSLEAQQLGIGGWAILSIRV